MNTNHNARPEGFNPIAEILEPIRQRVLRERMARDERDGCVLVDHLDGLEETPPGA